MPEFVHEATDKAAYDEEVEAATAFLREGKEDTREFVSGWGYSADEDAVTDEEMAEFAKRDQPRLEWLARDKPDHKKWSVRLEKDLRGKMSEASFLSLFRVVTDTEDDIDLLFDLVMVLLAAITAGSIVREVGRRAG